MNRASKLASKQIFISCVIPVHNEEQNISLFLSCLTTHLKQLTNNFEIILIDDGSTDQSVQYILPFVKYGNIKLIELSRNFGKEYALSAGLEHSSGDVTVMLDADFQHPLPTINLFLEQWALGYDMVYGIRQNRNHDSWLKRWITKHFYKTMLKITKINMVANAGDFRLLAPNVVAAIKQCQERNRYMKGLYSWVGFKSIGVPFEVAARAAGNSSWSFTRLAELAITGITSFSDIPLRIWGVFGFGTAFCAFIFALWICVKTIIFGVDVPGYASIMVAIFFFCGVQLLSIGVLGEYIAKIFTEVKQRPRYIINKTYGFTEVEVKQQQPA